MLTMALTADFVERALQIDDVMLFERNDHIPKTALQMGRIIIAKRISHECQAYQLVIQVSRSA